MINGMMETDAQRKARVEDEKLRLRRVVFSLEIMVQVCETRDLLLSVKGLPANCTFRGSVIDPTNNSVVIFVSHPSFDKLPQEGAEVPKVEVVFDIKDAREWNKGKSNLIGL